MASWGRPHLQPGREQAAAVSPRTCRPLGSGGRPSSAATSVQQVTPAVCAASRTGGSSPPAVRALASGRWPRCRPACPTAGRRRRPRGRCSHQAGELLAQRVLGQQGVCGGSFEESALHGRPLRPAARRHAGGDRVGQPSALVRRQRGQVPSRRRPGRRPSSSPGEAAATVVDEDQAAHLPVDGEGGDVHLGPGGRLLGQGGPDGGSRWLVHQSARSLSAAPGRGRCSGQARASVPAHDAAQINDDDTRPRRGPQDDTDHAGPGRHHPIVDLHQGTQSWQSGRRRRWRRGSAGP